MNDANSAFASGHGPAAPPSKVSPLPTSTTTTLLIITQLTNPLFPGNICFDFILGNTKGDSTSTSAQELMLWLEWEGGQLPIGWDKGPVATIDSLFGTSWKLYEDVNHGNGMTVVSHSRAFSSFLMLSTRGRDLSLLADQKFVQDYVTIPDQLWLDGIASTQGRVRQFVAMPMGSGYTVESQVTGKDVTGGLQFEITPAKFSGSATKYNLHKVFIKILTGKTIPLSGLSALTAVENLQREI